MAWIKTNPDEVSTELSELYDEVADPVSGKVDHIMGIHSLHPGGLRAHFDLYREVMAGTATLRKVDREMIALIVSQANDCHY